MEMMNRFPRSSNRGLLKSKAVRNSVLPRCVVPWSHLVNRHSVQRLSNARIMNRINTMRTGDADLRFYVTTVQDG